MPVSPARFSRRSRGRRPTRREAGGTIGSWIPGSSPACCPRFVGAEVVDPSRRWPLTPERCEEEHLHDGTAVVVPVGAEAVHDAVERSPRVEVGEERVVETVGHLGVAHPVDDVAGGRSPALARGRGGGAARSLALGDGERRLLIDADVEHRPQHVLLGRLPVEQRARRGARCDHASARLPDVDLRVGVTERDKDLGVRRADVVRLAERLLRDLPVGPDHLADVSLHVPVGEVPRTGELPVALVHERRERWGAGVGVDEHEPLPRGHLTLRQMEVVRQALVDVREVPPRRHPFEVAAQPPREPVERAPQL